jgi:hypothetical protein
MGFIHWDWDSQTRKQLKNGNGIEIVTKGIKL